jgi:GT2 family glycosyltransferase
MNHKKVSLVVVTWNSSKDIEECLKSLENQSYPIQEIIVVDNLSGDDTVEIIKNKFPDVHLIESEVNTFFTGGHNLGMKTALKRDLDYVAIINPDTKANANWIEKSIEVFEKFDRVGIVGPKVKFWNNEKEGLINSAGMIYDGFMQGYDRGFEEKDKGQYDKTEEVKAVTGAAMVFDVKMLNEIGFFWERLKMYLEDMEICIRARKAGWKVMYTPETEIGHKWMQSTSQSKVVQLNKWKMRNWLYIALRHYQLKSKIAVIWKWLKFKITNY